MLFCRIIVVSAFLLFTGAHPFYLSVTDLKYNDKRKAMEVSCKLFTNDFESTLKKLNNKAVDLLHPKDKKETETLVAEYINKHLLININGKKRTLHFIGYEKEEDAVLVYLEIEKCETPKQLLVNTSLLYDYLKEEINIVRLDVHDNSKSSKVSNPDTEIKFSL